MKKISKNKIIQKHILNWLEYVTYGRDDRNGSEYQRYGKKANQETINKIIKPFCKWVMIEVYKLFHE